MIVIASAISLAAFVDVVKSIESIIIIIDNNNKHPDQQNAATHMVDCMNSNFIS